MAIDLSKVTDEQLENAAKSFLDLGTIRELKGITDAEMEAVYSMGFSFYNTGRYDDAEKVFRFLVLFDHICPKYWTGLGAVMQMKRDYQKAVQYYGYASFLDLKNPKPQYFAAECFAAMGDKPNAISALEALEMYCPENTEEGREYRKKAAELKAKLEK